ncbi:PaaI family thioesterase [Halioxenophilus aromaticivorans]|uniref:PaaI family thioesterase n=1 Tax=Halioxenophilus aromaticivorans TaxID=1306992 RepID=A0AAV3U429_9ALTE
MAETKTITQEQLLAEGWQCFDNLAGFTVSVGPLWRKFNEQGHPIAMGIFVTEAQTNNHIGTLHGGALMTFADMALGSSVVASLGEERFKAVTTALNTQFVSVAKVGDFVFCEPEIVSQKKKLLFVRGVIQTNERVIGNCDGIWSVLS